MNETSLATIGYIVWMMILLLLILSIRIQAVLTGTKRTNEFKPEGTDVSAFSGRACRVHANCYEHFAIFGGLTPLLSTLLIHKTKLVLTPGFIVMATAFSAFISLLLVKPHKLHQESSS